MPVEFLFIQELHITKREVVHFRLPLFLSGKTGIFRSYFTKVTPTDYQLVTFLKYPDFCCFLPITVPVASRYAGLLTR